MPVLTVKKPLRDKLGDEGVDSLIEIINEALGNQKNDILQFVEEKFEHRLSEEIGKVDKRISNLEKEMSAIKSGLSAEIKETESGLLAKIRETESGLLAKIAETHADLIKWMFIFWVGQVAVILGLLFAFFR